MTAGTLFIIAAPSGAGKTSLVTELSKNIENLLVSISYTTRPARPGEESGVNYFFVDGQEFQKMVEEEVFLEHAKVLGSDYSYGTSRAWVEKHLAAGQDVILEIDWQGAQQIRKKQADAVSIFILPPSREELRARLEKRKQDQADIIEQRMQRADDEIAHHAEFDYLVVNDQFEKALEDLESIIQASRLRCKKQALESAELLAEFTKNQ